jgi:hypothetical protein
MSNEANYEKIREEGESFYRKIGKIRCPALNGELVHFNSEGFNHLIYKGNRSERNRHDQITKLKLLPKAKKLVEISTTYQEYEEAVKELRVQKFKKIVRESKIVKYWDIRFLSNMKGNPEDD